MSESEREVCPYLGSLHSTESYWPDPSSGNRCYALGAPTSVDEQEQRILCLGGDYSRCPRLSAGRRAGSAPAAKPRRKPARPLWGSLSMVIGGVVLMGVLLACSVGLVLYQTSRMGADGELQGTPAASPTSVGVYVPEEGTLLPVSPMPATPTETPLATWTVPALPTETFTPEMTFTALPPTPTQAPSFTPLPLPTPQPRATSTPRAIPTPRFTNTPWPTNTPRMTYTPSPTRTITPTRTPTTVPYGVTLSASPTSQQVHAGETAVFNVSLRNAASIADNFDVELNAAVMGGWVARMVIDGADRGTGPVTISVSGSTTKAITVQIVVSADAVSGDAGEVYLSATSKSLATATDSISLSVSVIE